MLKKGTSDMTPGSAMATYGSEWLAAHPETPLATQAVTDWFETHTEPLDIRTVGQYFYEIDGFYLAIALENMVRSGKLTRVYKLLLPDGSVAPGEYTSIQDIPSSLDHAKVLPIFSAAVATLGDFVATLAWIGVRTNTMNKSDRVSVSINALRDKDDSDLANLADMLDVVRSKIEAATDLNPIQRKQALIQLAFIGEQVSEPAEDRQESMLKSVYQELTTTLTNVASLATIWPMLDLMIKSIFG